MAFNGICNKTIGVLFCPKKHKHLLHQMFFFWMAHAYNFLTKWITLVCCRAATRNSQTGQLHPPKCFANMMAFTYCTRNVTSRDCVTSTWTSSQYSVFAYVCAASYRILKNINQSVYHVSENSQPRTGDKLWDASCEMKSFYESDVVVVNVTSQSRDPHATNRGYCYSVAILADLLLNLAGFSQLLAVKFLV